jgi:hypothetical protein
MTDSLDKISKGMLDEDFKFLNKNFNEEELDTLKYFINNERTFKGIYPYEYIDSIDRLEETKLPPIEKFYSTLKQEGITKEEYKHAQNIWKTFKCKTLQDYHDIYLKTDVLILADAFEKFRTFNLYHHEIDPCYCFSLPGLTWECGLKYTNVELELLSDPDMILMFEKGIRGGFSGVLGKRMVKAFNKQTPNYDDGNKVIEDFECNEILKLLKKQKRNGDKLDISQFLKTHYLLYIDANNLYGWSMSQPLPVGDFEWEEDPKYYKKIPTGRGCIIECDLEYTEECKRKTNKYPLAPDKVVTMKEELSQYQLKLLGEDKLGKVPKLQLNLKNKERYVLHYKVLKFYLSLGMKVTKVRRIISFKEEDWLKSYMDFNTKQRTEAKSEFEKNLFKNMNCSFFGKTMENIRERINLTVVTDIDKKTAIKLYSKPSFKDLIFFNEKFIGIQNIKPSIKFNKPIYLGMCILDLSKLLMYEFYYNKFNKQFPDNEILYGDTDSLVLNIYTVDLYKELENMKEELDTCDYPKDHPLYSLENKKVVGKFKDELNGKIMTEFIALRSKAYAFKLLNEEKKKLKGMSKTTIKKDIKFEDYKKCVLNSTVQYNKMHTLNSDKHKMFINEINKKSLSPFDDKRYICIDGITTFPYGLIPED